MTDTLIISTSVSGVGHGLVMTGNFDTAFVSNGVIFGTAVGGGIGIFGQAGSQRVTVAGTLVGTNAAWFQGDGASLTVTETGLLNSQGSGVRFEGQTNMVSNAGTIVGLTAITSFGSLTVLNDGRLQGHNEGVSCDGNLTLKNSGTIQVNGLAVTSTGAMDLQNLGTIYGEVWCGVLNDSIVNTGTMTGIILMSGGADLVDNSAGRILSRVMLDAGDDQFLGGSFAETVHGGSGQDEVSLAGGDDRFMGQDGDGSDDLDGGAGLDIYDGRLFSLGQNINLTSGLARAGGDTDVIQGFERVWGGSGRDVLTGDALDNTLRGAEGNDTLAGNAGADKLYGDAGNDGLSGGDGNDRIWGGEGRDNLNGGTGDDVLVGGNDVDVMTGGAGADRFVWTDTQEFVSSGLTGIERITDFQQGQDKIDLSQIDANPGGADDAYAFVATWTDFNQVAVRTTATQTFVIINATDFIRLDQVIALTAADFIL